MAAEANMVDLEIENAVKQILGDELSGAEEDVAAASPKAAAGPCPSPPPTGPSPLATPGPSPTLSATSSGSGSGGKNLAMVKRISEDLNIRFSDDDEGDINDKVAGEEMDLIVLSSDDEGQEVADEKQQNHLVKFDVKQEPIIEVKKEVVVLPIPARDPEQVGCFVPPEVGGSDIRYVE